MLRWLRHTLYRPWLKLWLRKKRVWTYRGIRLQVFPGVFHPKFFYSTRFLISELETKTLQGKSLLELGAGSGLISIFTARLGAHVTASDISGNALRNVQFNADLNGVVVSTIQSDLFDHLSGLRFDFIIINPPYFASDPGTEASYAWYCGRNFEYFHRLFPHLKEHMSPEGVVIMVLSEKCDLQRIRQIAAGSHLNLIEIKQAVFYGEKNYLYSVK